MSSLYKPCDKILEKLDHIMKICIMNALDGEESSYFDSKSQAAYSEYDPLEESKFAPMQAHRSRGDQGSKSPNKKNKKKSKKEKDKNIDTDDFLDQLIAENQTWESKVKRALFNSRRLSAIKSDLNDKKQKNSLLEWPSALQIEKI